MATADFSRESGKSGKRGEAGISGILGISADNVDGALSTCDDAESAIVKAHPPIAGERRGLFVAKSD